MSSDRKNFRPEGIFDFAQTEDIFNTAKTHVNGARHTPFISSSYIPFLEAGPFVIFKVSADRTLAIPSSFSESEILVPFFIHPNEILAIVDIDDSRDKNLIDPYSAIKQSSLANGLFRFLYVNPETSAEAVREIVISTLKARIRGTDQKKGGAYQKDSIGREKVFALKERILKRKNRFQVIEEIPNEALLAEKRKEQILQMSTAKEILFFLNDPKDRYDARAYLDKIEILEEIGRENIDWALSRQGTEKEMRAFISSMGNYETLKTYNDRLKQQKKIKIKCQAIFN